MSLSCPTPREGWQPIETAPKDGTRILMFVPKRSEMHVGYIRKVANGQIVIVGNHLAGEIGQPTHWRPLPEPPEVA